LNHEIKLGKRKTEEKEEEGTPARNVDRDDEEHLSRGLVARG
jgi:hypothetical protein